MRTTLALYWSETTLLGSTMRLGEVLDAEPPGDLREIGAGGAALAAEAVADDAPRRREGPLAVLEVPAALELRFSAITSAVDQSWPGPMGLGNSFGLKGLRSPAASMARRSASLALAKASFSMLLMKPWKLAPPALVRASARKAK